MMAYSVFRHQRSFFFAPRAGYLHAVNLPLLSLGLVKIVSLFGLGITLRSTRTGEAARPLPPPLYVFMPDHHLTGCGSPERRGLVALASPRSSPAPRSHCWRRVYHSACRCLPRSAPCSYCPRALKEADRKHFLVQHPPVPVPSCKSGTCSDGLVTLVRVHHQQFGPPSFMDATGGELIRLLPKANPITRDQDAGTTVNRFHGSSQTGLVGRPTEVSC